MASLPSALSETKEFVLKVGSKKFTGWLEVSVDRSMEEFANQFSLRYCDKWTLADEPWEIFPGDNCILTYGDAVLITGYVTQTEHDIGDTYDLSAAGRSLTGDLVDCSVLMPTKKGQWLNVSLVDLVTDLCAPFAIDVEDRAKSAIKFKRFEIEEGETVFDAIERACSIRACMPITTTDGNVALVRSDAIDSTSAAGLAAVAGLAGDSLDMNSVMHRNLHHSEQDRYSDYVFKGQCAADDEFFTHNATTQKGTAQDASITRYRPLLIMTSSSGNKKELGERAIWERNARAARSDRVTYTVDGLADSTGAIWQIGNRIKVKDDLCKINSTLLIAATRFRLDSQGIRTELELVSTSCYSRQELPERGNAWNR